MVAKNANPQRWPLRVSADGQRYSQYPRGNKSLALPPTGIVFPNNLEAGSDIRIVWSGSALLSRTSHTAIWKAKYEQQTGYYAVAWHSENTGTWPASMYQFGTHPYPAAEGTVDGNGQATDGTASAGTDHFWEIAGLGASDFLASPGGVSLGVVKDAWLVQARKCEVVSGTTLRHTFIPDVLGNPAFAIVQDKTLASLNSPSAPAFYIGASEWRSGQGGGGATANDESPSCTLRALMLFDAPLSLADITTEAANEASNNAVTSAGIAAIWYSNKNPVPTDVADKQTQRTTHSPSWANANRPAVWIG